MRPFPFLQVSTGDSGRGAFDCLRQVVDDVIDVLDPEGDPDQAVADADGITILLRDRAV